MELNGVEIIAPNARAEWLAILRLRCGHRGFARDHGVRRDEIEVRALVDVVDGPPWLPEVQLVPAHMRNLILGGKFEPPNSAGHDTQTFVLAVFVAFVEE